MKKRQIKNKNYKIIAYRLIIIFSIVLIILILAWLIIIFNGRKEEILNKEETLKTIGLFSIDSISGIVSPENCNLTQVDWYINKNYNLDVSDCFSDLNGDNLSYRFGFFDDSLLSIIQNKSMFKLVPRSNWFGNGSFYVYANDALNETGGIVYYNIKYFIRASNSTINLTVNQSVNLTFNRTVSQTIIPNILNQTFGIEDPFPSGEIITDFFGNNQSFFVSNIDFDSLEWYLDGKSLKNNSNKFEIHGLSKGNHSVEVKIRKGERIDSKIWKVIIEEDEKGRNFIFDAGRIMFYLILVVVSIIILLVIWLFIEENRNRSKKAELYLKTVNNTFNDFLKREDLSRRFNIPR